MSRQPRISDLAWSLLQLLEAHDAALAECGDPWCTRFHIVTEGGVGAVVHSMTMNMLAVAGLIKRTRTANASYKVSDKGYQALLRRRLDAVALCGLVLEEERAQAAFEIEYAQVELETCEIVRG